MASADLSLKPGNFFLCWLVCGKPFVCVTDRVKFNDHFIGMGMNVPTAFGEERSEFSFTSVSLS